MISIYEEKRLPNGWEVVELETLCDLQNGYAFQSTDYVEASNTLNCRMSNIRPDGIFDIDYNPKFLPDSYAEKYSKYLLQDGDVIIAMTDMATEAKILGVPTIVFTNGKNILLNQRVGKLVIKKPKLIHFPYLKYALNREQVRRYYLKFAGGGLQINLGKKDLLSVKIPLPPLEEQRRIAAILDKADAVRRKRKEAIALTEELLRSAFLDMFGDPVTNPKGWGSGTILDVVANPKTDVRCGPFGTQLKVEEIVSEGIPMLGIENVKGGRFQASTSKYLTPSKAKELAAFNVQAGDVLVTRMGTIGHACVVPQGIGEARISYHLFRIRPNPDYCLPGFLASTITWSGTFLTQLERLAHGAIMAGLKTADLKEVRFLVPPVDLQKQYLKIVAETEKLLENQKKRIISDDALFNSLLQRAFQGEL